MSIQHAARRTTLRRNRALQGPVATLQEQVVNLETQVARLKKQLFGGGKGESLDRAQLLLALSQMEAQIKAVAPQQLAYSRTPAKRRSPGEVFQHLPVYETVEIVPAEVKADPGLYERIGEERTFLVDLIPPKLVKREIVRPKNQHRLDRSRPPLLAPAPSRSVMAGYASAGLLASVVVSKYAHHLPLFRQKQMSKRWGERLSRQSMADWVAVTAQWLSPIYLRMKDRLRSGRYIQADETPIRCHDTDEPTGRTFQGYLWAISRPDYDVVFDWRLTRQHGEITSLLDGFQGVLQSDGYERYARYVGKNPGVIRVACFAHARRRLNDAMETAPVPAGFMLRLIGHLYRMERDWDDRQIRGAERARRRTRDFELTLRLLKKAALLLARRAVPQSALGKACRYLLGQWDALVAYCDHGDTRLDTNLLENAIRPRPSARRTSCSSATPTRATALRSLTRSSSPASAAASIPSTTSATSSRPCCPPRGSPLDPETSRLVTMRVTLCDAACPDQ